MDKMAADVPMITITPERRGFLPFKELWEYRELLYFLAWRDVKVRYKQTAIGAAWAIIQPLATMVIFTAIFHRFARITSEGTPYSIFAYTGLLPWALFAGALQRSTQSLVGGGHLISKIYFPRIITPVAATLSSVVDFAMSFVVLLAMALWLGIMPTWRLVVLPAVVGLTLLTALSVGLFLSALNVRYRDVGHAIPFLIQLWMFSSPVAYPVTLVPERWRLLYSANPMAAAIEGFRWSVLGKASPDVGIMVVGATLTIILLLLGGLTYFRSTERTFADVI